MLTDSYKDVREGLKDAENLTDPGAKATVENFARSSRGRSIRPKKRLGRMKQMPKRLTILNTTREA